MTKPIQIVPAVLEEQLCDIESKIDLINHLVSMVQIDICDGKFVPSKTFGSDADLKDFDNIGILTREHDLLLELDMMVDLKSESELKKWLSAIYVARPFAVVIHYGSTDNIAQIIADLVARNIKVGLGVHLDMTDEDIIQIVRAHEFDYVQVMGIEKVGFGGQDFSERAIYIVKLLHQHFENLEISVDGGISKEVMGNLYRAGATRFAVGSSIFKAGNPQVAIEELLEV